VLSLPAVVFAGQLIVWFAPASGRADMKKPAVMQRVFFGNAGRRRNQMNLLQFDFFVFHVFSCFWIKFHDQHFVGRGFLVFGGRVKVTRAGSGLQLDFFACAFSHDGSP
jgi:hypothetical protein